jgi:hypothetical protein
MTITVGISPVFNENEFQDNNGNVAAGYYITTYEAGSFSTKQTSYSDSIATPNDNPIRLDSSGRLPPGIAIWLDTTLTYNLALSSDEAGLNIVQFFANINAVPLPPSSGGGSSAIWVLIPAAPTYVSATEFLVPGAFSPQFAVGNRVQIQNTDSTFQYATVVNVSYSSPNTYVTVQNDSSVLQTQMATVWYSGNVTFTSGATVDAGGVTFTSGLTYTNIATVGGQLALAKTAITNLSTDIAGLYLAWETTGGPTAYSISPVPASLGNADNMQYNIVVNTNSSGSPTLNVSGVGAAPLVQFNQVGTYVPAVLVTGQATSVIFNGTDWVVQNPVPSITVAAAYWSRYNNTASGSAGFVNYQSSTVSLNAAWNSSGHYINVGVAGAYFVTGSVTVFNQLGVGGNPGIRIYHNGADTGIYCSGFLYNNAGGYTTLTVSGVINCALNDSLEIYFDAGGGSGQPIGYSSAAGTGFFTGYLIV